MGKKKDTSAKTELKVQKKEKQILKSQHRKLKQLHCDLTPRSTFSNQKSKFDPYDKMVSSVEICEQPSPRVAASLTLLPTHDYFMFGGEFFDGCVVTVYDDAFKWNIEKNEWKQVFTKYHPKPRCSHQCCIFKDTVYLFGGEYSTGNSFHHYRDLWRFDLKHNLWNEVSAKGSKPSARSGHRMVTYKNLLVLFGGFHDAIGEGRYFNDLYIFTTATETWTKIILPPCSPRPTARSGFMMAAYPQGNGVFICGGYSKIKDTEKYVQGVSHSDGWWLNIIDTEKILDPKINTSIFWEPLGKKASLPSRKSGCAMITYKSLALCFGGVYDKDQGAATMQSVFFNELLGFDLEKKKWFKMKVLNNKDESQFAEDKTQKTKDCETLNTQFLGKEMYTGNISCKIQATRAKDEQKEESLELNSDSEEDYFGYIDVDGTFVKVKVDQEQNIEPYSICDESYLNTSESEVIESKENFVDNSMSEEICNLDAKLNALELKEPINKQFLPTLMIENKSSSRKTNWTSVGLENTRKMKFFSDKNIPVPRINAMISMKKNNLIIYGGSVEIGNQEYTLDDCWAINITKRNGWKNILRGTFDKQIWRQEKNSSESDFASEEFSVNNSSCSSSESEESQTPKFLEEDKSFRTIKAELEYLRQKWNLYCQNETPLLNESLKDFYTRTKAYWIEKYQNKTSVSEDSQDFKEFKNRLFRMVRERYETIEPVVERIAELQRKCDKNIC